MSEPRPAEPEVIVQAGLAVASSTAIPEPGSGMSVTGQEAQPEGED